MLSCENYLRPKLKLANHAPQSEMLVALVLMLAITLPSQSHHPI